MKEIAEWRKKIDAVDAELLKLLNQRAGYTVEIGHIKRQHDMPIYDPAREKKILQALAEKNPGPLSEEAIQRLFERIIDESRLLEKHASLGLGDDMSKNV
ncbi:MAG: chorismate mutase [Deferribacteres bacterium]|nr:chorismate mutase [candidate division KSB1 bacterium]MCB9501816.1 chorismate mutase [Deferribacteres bacterium]